MKEFPVPFTINIRIESVELVSTHSYREVPDVHVQISGHPFLKRIRLRMPEAFDFMNKVENQVYTYLKENHEWTT